MNIHFATSSFDRMPQILSHDYVPIAIDTKVPDGFNGLAYDPLTPEPSLAEAVKTKEIGPDVYRVLYEKRLALLSFEEVQRDLKLMTQYATRICLVTSAPFNVDSHRRWVAHWFTQNGTPMKEIYARAHVRRD